MEYLDLYNRLNGIESYEQEKVVIDERTVMRNFNFESRFYSILPGGLDNVIDDELALSAAKHHYEPDFIQEMLNKKDAEIPENIRFRYHIIGSEGRSKDVLFLFHGFNEKHWAKYLPWAKYIADKTGKSVILFPIAFHMNRAPALWSNPRAMYGISERRKARHPNILCSTLSNVAISTRLHNNPKRLVWSGLQTYYDVIDLIRDIKADRHPAVAPDARIDIFSYSIGSLLAEILMMTDESGFFSGSRFVSFCGGAAFNRISPVSKFILDSEASVGLYSHIVEHLESHLKRDDALRHYLGGGLDEGVNFRSMLNYNMFIERRQRILGEMSGRVYAIALKNDTVMPPYEIMNTLQGVYRDIPIRVDVMDYPYKYSHEEPFPPLEGIRGQVSESFRETFDRVCTFLK